MFWGHKARNTGEAWKLLQYTESAQSESCKNKLHWVRQQFQYAMSKETDIRCLGKENKKQGMYRIVLPLVYYLSFQLPIAEVFLSGKSSLLLAELLKARKSQNCLKFLIYLHIQKNDSWCQIQCKQLLEHREKSLPQSNLPLKRCVNEEQNLSFLCSR